MTQKHVAADIYGHVQGVGFRYATYSVAQTYQITGLVKNCDDGSVHLEAQGDTLDLEHFMKVMQHSPSKFAKIDHINWQEKPLANYSKFSMM